MSEKVSARVRTTGNLKVSVSARGHEIVSDEPPDNGGDDSGMAPRELLLGSLGSCVAMTLLLYARRKEWPLENVEVSLDHQRVHGQQGSEPEERITVDVSLEGLLDEEQRERLAYIATRCPVSRIITGNVVLDEKVTLRAT